MRQALLSLLNGKPSDLLADDGQAQDSELQELCEPTNRVIKQFNEAHDFLSSVSKGLLEVDPPPKNLLISPFKQLHANLRHLTWQTKQVATGDLSQHVDFLGEFSNAFNTMIGSLRERRDIELALKRSEERLALAIDGAQLGLWDYDIASGEVVFNERWAEMLEYSPEEIEPRIDFWHDLIHPEDKTDFMEAWESHLKCDTSMFRVEHRLLAKSGHWKWILCIGRIVDRAPQGKSSRVAGVFVDITDRKRSEDLIRIRLELLEYSATHSLEELLQKTLDEIGGLTNSPIGFYVFVSEDEKTVRLQTWSTRTMKEFCTAEGKGQHYPVDQAGVWADAIRERRPAIHNDYSSLPNRRGMPDGHSVLIRELVVPIMRSERIAAVLAIGNKPTDYTEKDIEIVSYLADVAWEVALRKMAEQALKESEDKYRHLFNNSEVGMFRTRLDGSEILDINEECLKIFGRTREEMQGKSSVIHWADPHEREEMSRRLNTDGRVTDFECKLLNKQGEVRTCVMSVRLYREQGVQEGSMMDITERKQIGGLALQSARLKAISDLSSGVAHHFNNLLQIIMASASLSLMELESGDFSQIKTTLEKMLEATSLGAETVRRLQTFANVRADMDDREVAVFDVASTARNAAEVSKPLWKSDPEKRGISIDMKLDLEAGCLVKGIENEVFEVFVNLMRNAAEAMPQGGDIEVKTHREADEVIIAVRDTGMGIAEADLSRVFQPFWSSKDVGIGKGMGLAVSHGLLKRHGGTISVQSELGAGTIFTIRLPLARKSVTKTEEAVISSAGDRLTILVIDDEQHITELLERICARAGHRVFMALSGQDALAVFNREHVDLVLCDLGMPGMSGWGVGKAIRTICQEKGITKPPFVLLTGWGGQELEKDKIAESGVDEVIAKPIDSAKVISTVQEIAERGWG